jgi:hypothetical protein
MRNSRSSSLSSTTRNRSCRGCSSRLISGGIRRIVRAPTIAGQRLTACRERPRRFPTDPYLKFRALIEPLGKAIENKTGPAMSYASRRNRNCGCLVKMMVEK